MKTINCFKVFAIILSSIVCYRLLFSDNFCIEGARIISSNQNFSSNTNSRIHLAKSTPSHKLIASNQQAAKVYKSQQANSLVIPYTLDISTQKLYQTIVSLPSVEKNHTPVKDDNSGDVSEYISLIFVFSTLYTVATLSIVMFYFKQSRFYLATRERILNFFEK